MADDEDYRDSRKRKYCYEDTTGNELKWDGTPCTATKLDFKIHRGHMIAARYGEVHGNKEATFTYTNAVPQEGSFNSGKWRVAEEACMITMAEKCQDDAEAKGEDSKTYIVVGVVPSTFVGKPRFFGSAGFGEFQGASRINPLDTYRISFPEIMWTAGCCLHTDGTIGRKHAFWRRNLHDNTDPVKDHASATSMFTAISNEKTKAWPGIVFHAPNVFPAKPGCN